MAEKKKKAETNKPVTEKVTADVPQDEYLVKGQTRSGLEFTIDKRIKDDARVMRYLTMMQNKRLDVFTQSDALFSLLELMFGTQDSLTVFLNEVAHRHNGVADVPSLIEELTDLFECIKLKNS